ncbi:hypothetical protein [Micrococcus sp. FDAARGOS_333]|uniref:hypothetical protein n=1 Tax=Micrococcus sp. FDAARGOS_333 TaxID=1930558 RepID=UPI000B4E7910|nr:hypothetical protein [Micrococcus sp. FDAARGOS_333]PNL17626.1 hypothetical protein CEQ11_005465 [Micrococcus sp. FDAARGOS_333]
MPTDPQTDAGPQTPAVPPPRNQGLGRIIVMVYAVFALSALARSLFQILSHFDRAPVAYVLSAFAAVVYIIATLSLARTGRTAWLVSLAAVLIELVGVVGVGLATVLHPELFADATVWSHFGAGYGYVPLVLPIVGLAWLLTHREPKES